MISSSTSSKQVCMKSTVQSANPMKAIKYFDSIWGAYLKKEKTQQVIQNYRSDKDCDALL